MQNLVESSVCASGQLWPASLRRNGPLWPPHAPSLVEISTREEFCSFRRRHCRNLFPVTSIASYGTLF